MDKAFERIQHFSDSKPTVDELIQCLEKHPTKFLEKFGRYLCQEDIDWLSKVNFKGDSLANFNRDMLIKALSPEQPHAPLPTYDHHATSCHSNPSDPSSRQSRSYFSDPKMRIFTSKLSKNSAEMQNLKKQMKQLIAAGKSRVGAKEITLKEPSELHKQMVTKFLSKRNEEKEEEEEEEDEDNDEPEPLNKNTINVIEEKEVCNIETENKNMEDLETKKDELNEVEAKISTIKLLSDPTRSSIKFAFKTNHSKENNSKNDLDSLLEASSHNHHETPKQKVTIAPMYKTTKPTSKTNSNSTSNTAKMDIETSSSNQVNNTKPFVELNGYNQEYLNDMCGNLLDHVEESCGKEKMKERMETMLKTFLEDEISVDDDEEEEDEDESMDEDRREFERQTRLVFDDEDQEFVAERVPHDTDEVFKEDNLEEKYFDDDDDEEADGDRNMDYDY